MSKDYYKILGVTEFDNAENIKTAYRKLARKYHPDIAGNSKESLLRFKEINEAYEVLSNSIKKEEYDKAYKFYNYAKKTSQNNSQTNEEEKQTTTNPNKDFFKNINQQWEDFVSKKQKKYSQKEEQKFPKRGKDINTDIEITILEALCGVNKIINVLQTQVCPVCKGRKFINGSTCHNCKGKGDTVIHKKFTVKIPAEIKDKSKIRLAGEGESGINGGTNGDLYITIHIKENNDYKTEGLNIYKTLTITPYEAVLGGNIEVQTISGNIIVKITPYTQNGQKIRVSGRGIVQNEKIGDMILTVEINIPKNLSNEEIDLYKKLEKLAFNDAKKRI